MSAPKIDWTRPLRVVGTHEKVWQVRLDPWEDKDEGVRLVNISAFYRRCDGEECVAFLRADGSARPSMSDPLGQRAVENIPPEPRIVEGWMIVPATMEFMKDRPTQLATGYRVAKVLIEEHD